MENFVRRGFSSGRSQEANDTHTSAVYPAVTVAYFAQTVCPDSSLCLFEQQLEARKTETFTGKTPSKSFRKARIVTFFTQMFVLQNVQFASDNGFRSL